MNTAQTCNDEPATLTHGDWHLLMYRVKHKLMRDFLYAMIETKIVKTIRTYGPGVRGQSLDIELNLPNGETDVFHIEYSTRTGLLTWEDFTGFVRLGKTAEAAADMMGLVLKHGAFPFWINRKD
jgi:hypothetical protein